LQHRPTAATFACQNRPIYIAITTFRPCRSLDLHICPKRPIHIKRGLQKRPTDFQHTCIKPQYPPGLVQKSKGTYVCQKKPAKENNWKSAHIYWTAVSSWDHINVKWDLYISKEACKRKQLEVGTYLLNISLLPGLYKTKKGTIYTTRGLQKRPTGSQHIFIEPLFPPGIT